MQLPRFRHLAFMLLALWLSAIVPVAGQEHAEAHDSPRARSIHVVADDNYPPYLFRNNEGKAEGYLVDLWQLWARKTGVELKLEATAWTAAQQMINRGQADVIDMIFRTPQREPLYDFSKPYANLPANIYHHVSIGGISDTTTLQGFRVGVMAGDACIDILVNKGITSLVTYANYSELIRGAQRQEVKVFCLDEHPANFYLYRLNAEREFLKAFMLYQGQFHRAVRKGDVDTLQLIESGMRAITPDEEAALRKKWFGSPIDITAYARYAGWSMLALIMLGSVLALWNLSLRRTVAAKTRILNSTVEELHQSYQSVAETRENLAATLEAIPDLLFEFDGDGRYVAIYANKATLLAAPQTELIGKLVDETLPAEAAQTVHLAIEHTLANGSDYGRIINLPLAGRRHWFELSATRKGSMAGPPARVLMLSRDITQRREAEQELLAMKEAALLAERDKVFRDLFATAPVAMAYCQGERIESVNRKFSELFGYTQEEVPTLAAWWPLAYPDPDFRRQVSANWQEAMALAAARDGALPSQEYRITCRDGRQISTLIGGQLVGDGIIVTLVDVTLFRNTEVALKQAKEAAEAASRAKSVFLANMSHELRTPMNAIMGMTALALRRAEDPRLRDQLGKIDQASRHLLAVINDILDISKIEAERLTLEQAEFRFGAVLENVSSIVRQKAAEKKLRLLFQLSPAVAALNLRGDPLRLGQVLLNLAGNAIKFTDTGSVNLRIDLAADDGTMVLLRCTVADTGIGIADADKKRLFTAFEQADGSMTRKYGGTGLGLSISKRLVELMGGEIGVDSQLGQGSTFWFTARVGKIAAAAGPAPATSGETAEARIRQNFSGTRVLLAEDEPINQEVSCALLEAAGLRVDLALDGAIATEMTGQNDYALILMDMQMPRLNGLEATRLIRLQPRHAATPIIAMTANAFDEDRQACLAAGMNDHIGKPVDPEVLFSTMLKWLEQPNS